MRSASQSRIAFSASGCSRRTARLWAAPGNMKRRFGGRAAASSVVAESARPGSVSQAMMRSDRGTGGVAPARAAIRGSFTEMTTAVSTWPREAARSAR